MERYYMSDDKVGDLAVEVAKLLHGEPMGQALRVLEEAKLVLLDGHVVDVSNERFRSLEQEWCASCDEEQEN